MYFCFAVVCVVFCVVRCGRVKNEWFWGGVYGIMVGIMLRRLSVRNLAVVESAEAEFGAGLNVITGETGAGKSVLMGALRLLMGGRADRSIIRTGEMEASVNAIFEFESTQAIDAVLEEADLPLCEEGICIIRRTIQAEGAGRVRVNDMPATAALLRRLAPFLADIHGPNDNLSLLDGDFQLDLLTSYAQAEAEVEQCRLCWTECQQLRRALRDLTGDPGEREAEVEALEEALEEIRRIQPTEEDGEALIQQHAEAANAEEMMVLGNRFLDGLSDGERSVSQVLVELQRVLQGLSDLLPDAVGWSDTLGEIQSQVEDLSQVVSMRLSRVDTDPEHLEQLEQRLAAIQRLKRRYGPTLEDVFAFVRRSEERLAAIANATGDVLRLKERLVAAEARYEAAAAALHACRLAAAPKLSQAITRELRDLGFAQASFPIGFSRGANGAKGYDVVTFAFEPNPGEAPRPLAEIASSGEIARVMLAVRVILARHDATQTLIFDEIDANIGGETSRHVGEKLRRLGQSTQILCITHQPQAAVYGHLHFRVHKMVEGGRTMTCISSLRDHDRPEEIARMLGGADFAPSTLQHAREMLAAVKGV